MTDERMREYLAMMRGRYQTAIRAERSRLVDEVGTFTGYHRKAVIRSLNQSEQARRGGRRGRPPVYDRALVPALVAVWE